MNGRRLFRKYAQSKGKVAKEFVRVEQGFYEQDTLVTKGEDGAEERTSISYRDMVHWIIASIPETDKKQNI
jgi:hypothetical protein